MFSDRTLQSCPNSRPSDLIISMVVIFIPPFKSLCGLGYPPLIPKGLNRALESGGLVLTSGRLDGMSTDRHLALMIWSMGGPSASKWREVLSSCPTGGGHGNSWIPSISTGQIIREKKKEHWGWAVKMPLWLNPHAPNRMKSSFPPGCGMRVALRALYTDGVYLPVTRSQDN